jgi:putative FmdB family regulatory protein
MPIYEYQCGDCDHVLEALQKISEEPLKFCPECGAPSLKKLLSAPRFRLKGSGWYETDFKSAADKRRNLAGEKSDSKPAKDSGSDKSTSKDTAKDTTKATSSPSKAAE